MNNLKFYVIVNDEEILCTRQEVESKYRSRRKYISKSDFDKYFFDLGYSRKDFQKLGVGSKCFINSYHRHYTEAQRRIIHGQKLSRSQRRNNSNLVNKGKLKKVLNSHELIKYLDEGFSIAKMSKIFKVAPQTVKANLDLLGKKYISQTLRSGTVAVLEELEAFCKVDLISHIKGKRGEEVDTKTLQKAIQTAELICATYIDVLAKIRQKYSLGGSSATRNRYERYIIEYLVDNNLTAIPQYRITTYPYDICVPELKVLIEVDGYGHNSKTDLIKTKQAKDYGYSLIRLNVSKLKSIKKCKHIVQSKISKKLESMKYGI